MSDSTNGIPPVPVPAAPAGWYDDGSGRQRYWDGIRWTDHYADTYLPPQAEPVAAPAASASAPARKSRKGMWITLGVVGGLLLVALLGGIVAVALSFLTRAADGMASGGDPIATAPAESPQPSEETEPSDEAEPEPPAESETAVFGETWEYTDGLAVTVSPPVSFEPSGSAFPVTDAPAYVMFQVTIANRSEEPYEPLLVASVLSGTSEGEEVFDSANGLEGPPSAALPPGRQVTFTIGFAVSDADDLMLRLTPGPLHEDAIFVSSR
jgi:hypothetical protein